MSEAVSASGCDGQPSVWDGVLGLALALVLAPTLPACSPALDWREVPIDQVGLVTWFPCRPAAQTRELPLGGHPVVMTLRACETGGATFAVVVADVKDPAQVGVALAELRAASEAKQDKRAAPAQAKALAVDGATPQPAAGRWVFQGRRTDGAALHVDTAVFARGTWVVQATVIGPVDAAAFFEALRFGP